MIDPAKVEAAIEHLRQRPVVMTEDREALQTVLNAIDEFKSRAAHAESELTRVQQCPRGFGESQ